MNNQMLDQILTQAVRAGASDIHFKVGSAPGIRQNGTLRSAKMDALTDDALQSICTAILAQARHSQPLDELREFDGSYSLPGVARFRASVFRQRNTLAAILRAIPIQVPTFEQLGVPQILTTVAQEERGLVLVTGVTGSGKTSTLAAMVNHINSTTSKHILCIEDPIEFVHTDIQGRVTQREVGPDTASFSAALRSALRQDPDVILLGEMRDEETVTTALQAAETGHLVLATAHTTDTVRTIGRLVGAFPGASQHNVRHRLSETLKACVAQRLLPRADGRGRVVAMEIMINRTGIDELIRDESRTKEITDFLARGHDVHGTQSFDQHVAALMRHGLITEETALGAVSSAADFARTLNFTQ